MAKGRDRCVGELVRYLNETYAGDNYIKQWQNDYANKIFQKPILNEIGRHCC